MCNINTKVGGSFTSKSGGGEFLNPGAMFTDERPSSAMSEMSINMHDDYTSRAESRMDHFGDDISDGILSSGFVKDFSDKVSAPVNFENDNLTENILAKTPMQEINVGKDKPDTVKEEKIIQTIKVKAVVKDSQEQKKTKD